MPGHIITDHNYSDFINPVIDGERKSTGLILRDYGTHPEGCFAFAEPFPDDMLVPEAEIQDRIDAMTAAKATLLDMREMYYDVLKSLDQNGKSLCWAFSTTKAIMYLRAIMGEPLKVLSAWYVAGKVKGWRDQGGWGGESLAQIVSGGVPTMDLCPSYKSSYDTADTRANAALHKCTEWWEGSSDPDKALHQAVSAELRCLPTINDYSWMGHSMCGAATTRWKGGPQRAMDNSWGEKAGQKGLLILDGNKAKPNGLWIPRVTNASLV